MFKHRFSVNLKPLNVFHDISSKEKFPKISKEFILNRNSAVKSFYFKRSCRAGTAVYKILLNKLLKLTQKLIIVVTLP